MILCVVFVFFTFPDCKLLLSAYEVSLETLTCLICL